MSVDDKGSGGTLDQTSLFHDLFDRRLSEAEKVRGETLAESHLVDWKTEADFWVRHHLGHEITAEDIEMDIGQPTDTDGRPNNHGVGGYIAGLAKRGVLEKVGWTKSTRVSNHASDLRLWRVVNLP
jgi:hypothetical protein